MKNKKTKNCLALGVMFVFAIHNHAFAEEGVTPFQPGVSTGRAAGALPRVGLYFDDDNTIGSGELVNGAGQTVPVKAGVYINAPALLWVPKLRLFGAQYATSIVEPYSLHDIDTNGIGGTTTLSPGFYNTIITPIDLSWNLNNGKYISTGLTVYVPDGHYVHDGTTTAQTSYANNFWTFEPNIAFSYLKFGWNITLNNVFDFNTENNATKYYSGSVYYLDGTFAHSFGPVTLGLIGNFTQQFTDDTQFGKSVNSGNRWRQVLVGPLLAYRVGEATITARYLDSVYARNTVSTSFFHLSVSFPF